MQNQTRSTATDLPYARQLLIATATQKIDTVHYLIEIIGLHPDDTIAGKPTALCYALLKRDHCLMRYLIRQGANINHIDSHGSTPLHYATLSGCTDCLAFLLRSGVNTNVINRQGETPLTLSTNNECLKHCHRLLRQYTKPQLRLHQKQHQNMFAKFVPGDRLLH